MIVKITDLPETIELPSEEEVMFPIYVTTTMIPTRCISFKNLILTIRKVLESDNIVIVEEKSGGITFRTKKSKFQEEEKTQCQRYQK